MPRPGSSAAADFRNCARPRWRRRSPRRRGRRRTTATLGRDIGEAIRIATSGRPGPVHVSLPSDLLDARIDESAVVWPERKAPARTPLARCRGRRDRSPPSPARSGRSSSPARRLSNVARPRAARQARSRDRRARRDHGKPARHRRRHARRVPRSDQARRPDRAARQGARLHHQMGDRAGVRSGCAGHRDRSGRSAGRARQEGKRRAPADRLRRRCECRGATLLARAGKNASRRPGSPRRAPRSTTGRRNGARIVSQTPGRLHPAEVFRALRPVRRARSRHRADLRRRRVRAMGPEHAAGAPPPDQRRHRLDRLVAVVCAGGADDRAARAGVRGAGRRHHRLPHLRVRNRGAARAAVRRDPRQRRALERRERDPAPRLRREPHARLRAAAGALRPGGGGVRRPRRARRRAPPTCPARSSARSQAASPPAST